MKKYTELVNTVKCRKLQYLGHIMRNKERYILLQKYYKGKLLVKEGRVEEGFRG